MTLRSAIVRIAIFLGLVALAAGTTGVVRAEETTTTGADAGEVAFRLTLDGPVDPDDGFFIDVRCDGGDFCNGADEPRYVYFCAHPVIVDTVVCEAKSFEFTVAIPPQRIEYHLSRTPNVDEPDHESTVVLSGAWPVHGGSQVISLGYVYPGGTPAPAPALPDTAAPAP